MDEEVKPYEFQEFPKWVTVDGVAVLCEDAKAERKLKKSAKANLEAE